MSGKVLIVLLDGKSLVVIPVKDTLMKEHILDAYAKEYAFDRKEITGYFLDTVPNPLKEKS